MKKSWLVFLGILLSISLVACTPKPEPKTVDYYVSNVPETLKLLEECRNNPGKLKDDPDCINARQALTKIQATKPVKAVPY